MDVNTKTKRICLQKGVPKKDGKILHLSLIQSLTNTLNLNQHPQIVPNI